MKVGLIVEGHGEVHSAPLLLRRILQALAPGLSPSILAPHRVSRGQLTKEEGLQHAIEFMARKVGDEGRILLLLDADDDLPCVLGPRLLALARGFRPDRDVSVVVVARRADSFDKLFREVGRLFGLSVPPRP